MVKEETRDQKVVSSNPGDGNQMDIFHTVVKLFNLIEKTENKQKEAGVGTFKRRFATVLCSLPVLSKTDAFSFCCSLVIFEKTGFAQLRPPAPD